MLSTSHNVRHTCAAWGLHTTGASTRHGTARLGACQQRGGPAPSGGAEPRGRGGGAALERDGGAAHAPGSSVGDMHVAGCNEDAFGALAVAVAGQ